MARMTAPHVADWHEAELIGVNDIDDLVSLIAEQHQTLCAAEDDRANDERVIREQAAEIERKDVELATAESVIDLQNQQIERLRKDAERYRWLREQDWNASNLFVVTGPGSNVKLGIDCPSRDRLDDAIDAAREGKS